MERWWIDGHEVVVQVRQVGAGRYRWAWEIDGRHRSKAPVPAARADVARSEALLYAQLMLSRLAGAAPWEEAA